VSTTNLVTTPTDGSVTSPRPEAIKFVFRLRN
jgi:hypothetical protein